jgi:hypothetical protein
MKITSFIHCILIKAGHSVVGLHTHAILQTGQPSKCYRGHGKNTQKTIKLISINGFAKQNRVLCLTLLIEFDNKTF